MVHPPSAFQLCVFRLTEALLGGSLKESRLTVTIEIKRPEIEALIQQRLRSGGFENVEDVLFDALEIQGEREAWLQENKAAINAKIQRGLAQLDRGEGISGDRLRKRLEADKAAWLEDRSES
jgi:antitoxin ParD1/3/4